MDEVGIDPRTSTTGGDLRALREAAGVRRTTVAELLSVSRRRIFTLEGQASVRPRTASRYLAAVQIAVATISGLEAARAALQGRAGEADA